MHLGESNDVRLVQSQSCDHYTKGQYGRRNRTAACQLGRRRAAARPNPLKAAEAGIEPAPVTINSRAPAAEAGSNQRGTCLTVTRNYQQLPLRNAVCAAGFEPAISTSQASRDVQPSLPHAQYSKASGGNRTRTSAMARQQCYHYIMDAFWLIELSKIRAIRSESNRRCGITSAGLRH